MLKGTRTLRRLYRQTAEKAAAGVRRLQSQTGAPPSSFFFSQKPFAPAAGELGFGGSGGAAAAAQGGAEYVFVADDIRRAFQLLDRDGLGSSLVLGCGGVPLPLIFCLRRGSCPSYILLAAGFFFLSSFLDPSNHSQPRKRDKKKTNRSGSVDAGEVAVALASLGCDVSEDEVRGEG